MKDALDCLLAMAEPAEERDRLMLEPGISFWRSAGAVPAAGLRYATPMPAGLHISAGRGEMQSRIANDTVLFSGPQFALFTLAEDVRCETVVVPGSRWRSLGLWIEPGFIPEDIHRLLLGGPVPARPRPQRPCAAVNALITSTAHQRYRGVARDYALRAQAYALLASLADDDLPPASNPIERRRSTVDAVLAIIDQNYAQPPLLAELARRVGSNRRYLTRDFRDLTGVSISSYITARRLEHARDMLGAGLAPGEVAARVGLTASHFAQAYRRRFGLSPSRQHQKVR